MIKQLKIKTRLSISYLIIFIIFILLSIFSIIQLQSLSQQAEKITRHPFTVSNAVLRINTNVIKMHRAMKDVVLVETIAEIADYRELVANLEKEVLVDFELIEQKFLGEMEIVQQALIVFLEWQFIRSQVYQLMNRGEKVRAAQITKNEGALHVVKIEKEMEKVSDFAQNKALEFRNQAVIIAKRSFITDVLLLIIAIVIGFLLSTVITQSIIAPLNKLNSGISEISKGNFSAKIEIDFDDEIGHLSNSFNQMAENLSNITASRDELQLMQNQLQKTLKEKDILLREIHHRIKNNMALVSSFLSLQALYSENKEFKKLMDITKNRLKAMVLIHNILYKSENLSRISVREYIDALINEIKKSFLMDNKNISYIINIEDISFNMDFMLSCGIIVNELITNALKHAFTDIDDPQVQITFKQKGDQYLLTIQDNGKGLPENFNPEKSNTLGMNIVDQLVKQNNGIMEYHYSKGSHFDILFQIAKKPV
ncbi:MAG: HAMP domain-containing protein [Spirochaetes bacterium]|nr:HAMP domain-containing protein [Spirochaetota bacterium]